MKQSLYPSPGSLRVFVACLLSFTILITPIAAIAARTSGSSPTVREGSATKPSKAKSAEEELFVNPPETLASLPGPKPEPAPEPLPPFLPGPVTATMTATIANDDGDTKIDPTNGVPGTTERIDYTAILTNTGSDPTGLISFNDFIDPHTTFVAGSIKSTPVCFDQPVSTNEDVAKAITLTGQDPDGDSITFSIISGPSHGTLTPGVAGAAQSYAPTADYNGPDSFVFRVNDGTTSGAGSNGNSNQDCTVSITVNPVNDAPTFTVPGNPAAVNEDAGAQSVPSFIGASVRPGNPGDTLENGQTVSFVITGNTNAGLFSTPPALNVVGASYPKTATLTYTSLANQNGTAVITYHAHDDGGTSPGVDNSADQTFTITVNAVNDPPVVVAPAAFAVQANMKRTGLGGLLGNVNDNADNGVNGCTSTTFTVTSGSISATSPAGGIISNVNLSTGTFDFEPPPGFTGGNATFTYTVSDTGCPGVGISAPVTVTVAVSGPVIWFVNPAAGVNGTGTLNSPFNVLASANTAMGLNAGQRIFVYTGTTTSGVGVTLTTSQWLIGQGATDSSNTTNFDTLMGISPPANTIARPAVNGTKPTIQGRVQMNASNTRVQGINITPPAGTQALTGTSGAAMTGMQVGVSATQSDVTVTATGLSGSNAMGVSLNNAGGTFTFISVNVNQDASSNKPAKGISLTTTTGSFTVLGSGTTAGTGGTIQNTTNNGVEFKTATNVTLKNMNIINNATSQTVAGSSSSCGADIVTGNNLSCVANVFLQSATTVSLDNITITGSKQQGINGNAVNGLTITNCTVTGNGDESFEDGILLQNASGTVSITGTNVRDNRARELQIGNGSGTMTLNTSNSQYGHTALGTGTAETQQGILLQLFGTSNTTINATTLTISNNEIISGGTVYANGFQINADNGSPIVNGSITASTFDVNAAHVFVNVGGTSTVTFDTGGAGALNNTMTHAALQAINYTVLGGSAAITGNVTGTISGNKIGTAATIGCITAGTNCHAIDINSGEQWNGQMHLKIDSNTIQKVAQGIIFTLGGGNGVTPQVHAKVTNNNISNSSAPSVGEAIKLNTTVTSTNPTISVCWDVGGAGALVNTVTGDWSTGSSQASLYLRNRFSGNASIRLPGYGGSSTDDAAVTTYLVNRNAITAGPSAGQVKVLVTHSGTTPFVGGAACTTPLMLASGGVNSEFDRLFVPSRSGFAQSSASANSGFVTRLNDLYSTDASAYSTLAAEPAAANTSTAITTALDQSQLDAIVTAAIDRWSATGLTAKQIATLHVLKFDVSDLSGSYLGEANGKHILVDRDAQAKGWFVDAGPMSDLSFAHAISATRLYTDATSAPAGHVDLLTAIEHEMGHKLGLDDLYAEKDRDNLMYGYLTVGERRIPSRGQAANATPNQSVAAHFLSLLPNVETPVVMARVRSNSAVAGEISKATIVDARATFKTNSIYAGASAALSGARIATSDRVSSPRVSKGVKRSEARGQKSEVRSQKSEVTSREDLRLSHVLRAWNVRNTAMASPFGPMFFSGGTFPINGTGTGFILPAGKSTTIKFSVTLNNPPNLAGPTSPQVQNHGTLSGSFSNNPIDTNTVTTVVDLFNSTTTIASAPAAPNTGQAVTYTATVAFDAATAPPSPAAGTAPTGTVGFFDNGSGTPITGCGAVSLTGPVGTRTAQCNVAAIAGGGHSVVAKYVGDGNFDPSNSSALVQTVNQSSTTTAVVSSLNPSLVTQNVTFTATVTSGTALPITGTVTFKDGVNPITCDSGQALTAGVATCVTNDLIAGDHTITAVYGGDTNFTTSTGSLTASGGQNGNPQHVDKSNTTTALVSSLNPSSPTRTVTYTATVTSSTVVTGPFTGTVTFKDGASTIVCEAGSTALTAGGVATCKFTYPNTTGSPHSITAVYGGDSTFITSTSTPAISQVVSQKATTTTLTSSPNPSAPTVTVTYTATVASANISEPGPPTAPGTVTFKDGATAIVCENAGGQTLNGSGVATCQFTYPNTSGSPHSITAVYNGDAIFLTSTSSPAISQVVTSCSASVVVTSAADDGSAGTLRTAINTGVCDGGTITFDTAGVFATPQTISLTDANGELHVSKSMTITGPGASVLTVKRVTGAGTNFRVFEIDASKIVTISGMTISNGNVVGTAGGAGTGAAGGAASGGGVFNAGTLTLLNAIVSGNHVTGGAGGSGTGIAGGAGGEGKGGGIFNSGTLTLTNTTVNGSNSATGGKGGDSDTTNGKGGNGYAGGVYSLGPSALTLNNSTIASNQVFGSVAGSGSGTAGINGVSLGGGIFNEATSAAATATITNSTISGNNAIIGGGIFNDGFGGAASLMITGSTISGNSVDLNGGGIYNLGTTDNATLTITNSTISGNTAGNNGGGIYNDGATGTSTLTSVTVTGNRADNDTAGGGTGGGINRVSGTVTLKNAIVAGNFTGGSPSTTANDVAGTMDAASSYNLIGDAASSGGLTDGGVNKNIVGNAGAGTILITTILNTTLANNGGPTQTHALVNGSPALEKGNAFTLTTDQRGFARPVNFDFIAPVPPYDDTDIGAYEQQVTPGTPNAPDLDAASDTGTSSTDNITSDTSPTFTITGVTPGATVELLRDVSPGTGTQQVETVTVTGGPITSGTNQVVTLTVLGTVTVAGDASVTVTAVGMTGTPKTILVPVDPGNADAVAVQIRAALTADLNIGDVTTGFFTVSGAGPDVVLTAKVKAANDGTMKLKINSCACTGLTTPVESVPTIAGVAPGTAIITVTAAGMNNSPKTLNVAVGDGDTAAQVALKMRTALSADPDISAFFTISGGGADIVLTAKTAAVDDGTLSIATNNGTCTGLTPSAPSANTTPGAAGPVVVASGVAAGTSIQLTDPSVTASATPYLYTARQTVSGAPRSPQSASLSVTISNSFPVAPGTPDLQAGSDSFGPGGTNSDNLTNITPRLFDVVITPEAGATLELLRNGTPVDSKPATSATVTLTDSAVLVDGPYSYSARQTNAIGNATSSVTPLIVTIDVTAPAAPGTPDLQAGSDTFGVGGTGTNTDNNTNAASLSFDVGGTTGGVTVQLYRGATLVDSTAGGGTVVLTDATAPSGSIFAYTARQVDPAGNSTSSLTGLNVTVDRTATAAGVPDLQAGSDSGVSNSDNITKTVSRSFDIPNTENGSLVELYRGATFITSTTGNGGTVTLIDNSSPGDNTYTYTSKQTDIAGNAASSLGLNVTIDMSPNAPGTPDLQAGSDTGTLDTDDITGNGTHQFDISAQIGDLVELLRDGVVVASTTATLTSVTLSDSASLADGLYHYTARQTDVAGNVAPSAGTLDVTIDATKPSVAMTSGVGNPTATTPIPVTVTFSEPVTGFTAGDIVPGNGTVSNFAGGPTIYTFDLTPTSPGAVSADIAAGVATDTAGNANTAATQFNRTFDPSALSASITAVSPDPRNTSVSSIQIVFNKPVTGFDRTDLSLKLNAGANLLTAAQTLTSGDNMTWTLGNLSGLTGAEGTYVLKLTASGSGIIDNASNPLTSDATETWVMDTTAPSVTVSVAAGQLNPVTGPTASTVINFKVVFGESVTGFINTDVNLSGAAGATVANVSGSGTTYNVAVEGMTSNGAVTITIPAAAATDAAGNGNTSVNPTNTATVTFFKDDFTAFEVNTTVDADDGACTPLGTGNGCTLREAINAANADAGAETITFAPALTSGGPSLPISLLTALPNITTDMTIQGPGANLLTVERSSGAGTNFRIFTITNGPPIPVVIISGLTITKGVLLSASLGGGINNNGTLTINNCTISANQIGSSSSGGGIYTSGTLTINNSTISGNQAGTSSFGGGLRNDGTLIINNSTISGNQTGSDGGGILNGSGTLTLSGSTVTLNQSGAGGSGDGIFRTSGTVTLKNTIVAGNLKGSPVQQVETATVVGTITPTGAGNAKVTVTAAGMTNSPKTLNVAVANNDTASVVAGKMRAALAADTDVNAFFTVSGATDQIILTARTAAPNDATMNVATANGTCTGLTAAPTSTDTTPGGTEVDISGSVNSEGFNLIQTTAAATITETLNAGTNITGVSAQLFPLGDNGGPTFTHALQCTSPAIDKGFSFTLTTDQRGGVRPFDLADAIYPNAVSPGDGSDIGAYETQTGGGCQPVAVPPAPQPSTNEDTQVTITLKGTYSQNFPLTFAITQQPGHSTANLVPSAANCTFTTFMACTSTVSYTPSSNFNGLDSFKFKVSASGLDSDEADVNITVVPVNDPPVAIPQSVTTDEDTPLPITLNGSDVETPSGSLAFTVTVPPTHGTLSGVAPNVTYTPFANYNGPDSFKFTVTDTGDGASPPLTSSPATVSITVNPVNDAPVLDNSGNMSLSAINEDVPAASNTGTLVSAVIASAGGTRITDVDAGALTGLAVIAVNNVNGTWQFSIDNGTNWTPFGAPNSLNARLLASDATTRVRFLPNADFNGTVDPGLTFRAWDQTSGANGNTADTSVVGGTTAFSTATETASITVNAVNDVPSFTKGPDQTANGPVPQTVPGWATAISAGPPDEVGQTLTFLVSNNNNAIFSVQPSISPSGTLTYTPAYGFDGTATVTVQLKDNGGVANGGVDTSAAQTFTITVHALNNPPTLDALGNVIINEDAPQQTVNLSGITSGPIYESSQSLTVTATSNNTAVIPNPTVTYTSPNTTGSIRFTPVPDANGSATITVTVKDDGGTLNGGVDTFVRTFIVTVNAINDAPVNHVPGSQNATLNGTLIFSAANSNLIFISDVDAGSDPVQVTLKATDGTLTLNGTAGLSFSAGDGTDDQTMTFSGSIANINAALNGMKNLTFGSGVIEITTNDLGRNGAGGALSDTDTIQVTVIDNLAPALLTAEGSDRAIALDSVTFLRDPFALLGEHNFSSDHRTRITLFALHAQLKPGETASAITAEADVSGTIVPLTVESVRTVPNFDWLTQVVVAFPDQFATGGGAPQDVRVRIRLRGANSNQAVITIVPAP